jgi:hypothetical protein
LFGVGRDFVWCAAISDDKIGRQGDLAGRSLDYVADIAKAINMFACRNGGLRSQVIRSEKIRRA